MNPGIDLLVAQEPFGAAAASDGVIELLMPGEAESEAA